MKVFMTNGTLEFLEKLALKHPNITFFFMNDNRSTLAYYEGNKKKVFASGREYEAILTDGQMLESGFVIINNVPVPGESAPLFEDRFKQTINTLSTVKGFQAFRLLKPKRGNTYAVFSQWKSERDYENWKNSNEFKHVHKEGSVKQPAYFADRSFVTKYLMVVNEE